MKKVGIVGGIGPESTLEYYRGIIEAFKPVFHQHGFPEIALESIDLKAMMSSIDRSAWDEVTACIAGKFEVLRKGGADFGVIASNTPHKVFDAIQAQTDLPLLSIVTATLTHVRRLGVGNLCLLGTKMTMESGFYHDAFAKENIRLVVPDEVERDYIHDKIFSELEFGIVRDETRRNFLSIIDRIAKDEKIEGVVLGCTELPLLLQAQEGKVRYVDTTQIHIASIVEECRRPA